MTCKNPNWNRKFRFLNNWKEPEITNAGTQLAISVPSERLIHIMSWTKIEADFERKREICDNSPYCVLVTCKTPFLVKIFPCVWRFQTKRAFWRFSMIFRVLENRNILTENRPKFRFGKRPEPKPKFTNLTEPKTENLQTDPPLDDTK